VLDLRSGEIRAIVWATGFRPGYGWLDVPVVDAKGQLNHDGGVVDGPWTLRAGAARDRGQYNSVTGPPTFGQRDKDCWARACY
jgi:hypothetical protein